MTRSFEAWLRADRDIRTFRRHSEQWSEKAYEALWAEAQAGNGWDPEGSMEPADIFHESVDGLWPYEYVWMLRAAVVKDAVTAFEVYLEQSLDEVLGRLRFEGDGGQVFKVRARRGKGHPSPAWWVLARIHGFLGVNVDTPAIQYVRDLRHLLTHQGGVIRDEAQRDKYADVSNKGGDELASYIGGRVPLRPVTIEQHLDELGRVVRTVDPVAWGIVWNGQNMPPLRGLGAEFLEFVPVSPLGRSGS